jgi:hypothetical protein
MHVRVRVRVRVELSPFRAVVSHPGARRILCSPGRARRRRTDVLLWKGGLWEGKDVGGAAANGKRGTLHLPCRQRGRPNVVVTLARVHCAVHKIIDASATLYQNARRSGPPCSATVPAPAQI